MLPTCAFTGLNEADCIAIQRELSTGIVQKNRVSLDAIRTVAGVDIAYWNSADIERAVCCIIVIDFRTKEVIEKQHAFGSVTFPYIPGCLAFRELPLVLEAASKLMQKPDIFLFDGNGILHPRSMGLASHASFYLDSPTIGIAKRYFRVEGALFSMPGHLAGSHSDITKDGKILGRAVRTHTDVKPVFVSVGNYVEIDLAAHLALMLTDRESHIPIPTRYADLETHIMRMRG